MNKEPPDKFAKYKKYLTSYTTVQVPLASIIKHGIDIEKINSNVVNVNKIITHVYHYLKLYSLYEYKMNDKLPIINKELIKAIMKTICVKDNRGTKCSEKTKN